MATTAAGDLKDPALASAGHRRILWAERDMPVLRAVRERFEVEKPMAGIRVSACLHVTAETANLARTLQAGGAELVLIGSNPLSTQDDVAASLVQDFRIPVHAIKGEDESRYHRHIAAALEHRPNLTMDDGSDLVGTMMSIALGQLNDLHEEVRNWADSLSPEGRAGLADEVVASLEGTAAGVGRLRAMQEEGAFKRPVIAVNDAMTRHCFDNRHGTGQSTIDGVIRATDMLIAGKRVVVAGYGWRGKGVALRAKGLGARVIVTEVDPIRALEAVMDGFEVLEMIGAAPIGDLFITVTGNIHVIRAEHFAVMRDGAIVCNAGQSDAEIALDQLAEAATSCNRDAREFVDEYLLADGRRVSILGQGRPINLAAAHGHPSSVMDMSFAAQALAAEWALRMKGKLEPKVYNVPKEVDRWVTTLKLQSMGTAIDTLTPEQAKYLEGGEKGI